MPGVAQQEAALPGVRKEEKESCDDDKNDGESAPKVAKREPYRIREAVRAVVIITCVRAAKQV